MLLKIHHKHYSAPALAACVIFLSLMVLAGCSAKRVDTVALRQENAASELPVIRALPQSPGGPVTLQDAIHYALAHNLETKVRQIETAVQEEILTGKQMEMLPSLMAEFDYNMRNKDVPVSAEDADTGRTTLPPSIMREKSEEQTRAYLAWDLLDFGVTYFRARQAFNRLSIQDERIRKAKQRLVLDVTMAYGQALVAEKAVEMARSLVQDHNSFLRAARRSGEGAGESLRREIGSLESLLELSRYEAQLAKAKTRLAQLMGLAPGASVDLVDVDISRLPPELRLDLRSMEEEAIQNRPELSEKDVLEKIADDEARIALARMFPSPSMLLGYNQNSNAFLSVSQWFTVGLTVSWNLLSIPRRMSEREQAQMEAEMLRFKRVAVSVGIMAQVHIAAAGYQEAVKRFLLKEDISARRERLARSVESDPETDPHEALQEATRAAIARIECFQAYMDVLTAREMVLSSLGRSPLDDRGYDAIQGPPRLFAEPEPPTGEALEEVEAALGMEPADERGIDTGAPDSSQGSDAVSEIPKSDMDEAEMILASLMKDAPKKAEGPLIPPKPVPPLVGSARPNPAKAKKVAFETDAETPPLAPVRISPPRTGKSPARKRTASAPSQVIDLRPKTGEGPAVVPSSQPKEKTLRDPAPRARKKTSAEKPRQKETSRKASAQAPPKAPDWAEKVFPDMNLDKAAAEAGGSPNEASASRQAALPPTQEAARQVDELARIMAERDDASRAVALLEDGSAASSSESLVTKSRTEDLSQAWPESRFDAISKALDRHSGATSAAQAPAGPVAQPLEKTAPRPETGPESVEAETVVLAPVTPGMPRLLVMRHGQAPVWSQSVQENPLRLTLSVDNPGTYNGPRSIRVNHAGVRLVRVWKSGDSLRVKVEFDEGFKGEAGFRDTPAGLALELAPASTTVSQAPATP